VFADDAEGVTFSTVHKSKGGEADRVFILKPELMPHPKAGEGWEMDQEYNIMYVAWTRHKKALYFVGSGYVPPFTVPDDTEGQDRENYTDEQDREDYMLWADMTDEEMDIEFARREAEQERAAFASDPDYRERYSDLDNLFPDGGRFEDNIYRPSARELCEAMPNWHPTVNEGQLVLTRELAPGHTALCYTSIKVGQIAGGTGEDSIRVTRRDEGRDGRMFYYKNPQDWVTRSVPKDADTPAKAAAHLATKIEAQVKQFTRNCPECGKLQVKCRAGKGRDSRTWWKGTDGCRCRVEGGW